jgi:tellurite methyltransferase
MPNQYETAYRQDSYYWGKAPSPFCYRIMELMPAGEKCRVIDIGCGEGRNAVCFARNGYDVTAFDLAESGVLKTLELAREAGAKLDVFQADVLQYRLKDQFDIVFSSGVLHFLPKEARREVFANYKEKTAKNGINALNVFVIKPFIPRAPDWEPTAQQWQSGELFGYYHDWRLEYCTEEIFDCNSSGVPHKHAINRMIARKP